MKTNDNSVQDKAAKVTIPTDTVELPKPSKWEDVLLTLQLVGITLAILGAIWGIEYWRNG